MTQHLNTPPPTINYKTSTLWHSKLNTSKLQRSNSNAYFLLLVHQGLFTIPGCLHSPPPLPKGYRPPFQAACRWCLLWTCPKPCFPWRPKPRSPPYRDRVDWKENALRSSVNFSYTVFLKNNHLKGAQAWDIRSLGFSWFLHHKVSTCGRLRG